MKSVTIEGFVIDEGPTVEDRVHEFLKHNKYVFTAVLYKKYNIPTSTGDWILRRMAHEGQIQDLGIKRAKLNNVSRRVHLYCKK